MSTVTAPRLYAPANSMELGAAEESLGFGLPLLLRCIYESVGNGGFGPGAGMLGIHGGYADPDGRVLEERYVYLLPQGWRAGLLPLCDWGDAAWSCVDATTSEESIVTADHSGFTRTVFSLETFLIAWCQDVDLHAELYEIDEAIIKHPFTRQPTAIKRRGRARGVGPW